MTLRIAPHLVGGAFGDAFTVVQHGDAVADAHDDPHVVLDEQNGDPKVVAQPRNQRRHLGGLSRVHSRRRLVEQQEHGIVAERAGDLESALVAVRQVLGELGLAATQADQAQ